MAVKLAIVTPIATRRKPIKIVTPSRPSNPSDIIDIPIAGIELAQGSGKIIRIEAINDTTPTNCSQ